LGKKKKNKKSKNRQERDKGTTKRGQVKTFRPPMGERGGVRPPGPGEKNLLKSPIPQRKMKKKEVFKRKVFQGCKKDRDSWEGWRKCLKRGHIRTTEQVWQWEGDKSGCTGRL